MVGASAAGTSSLRAHHLLLSLELRVERVAQAVTEEREADQREGDDDRREERRGAARSG